MKKILALLLTAVMMLGMVSFASAEALEPVTLKIMFHGSNVTDDSAVLATLNPYLQEKIGVTLQPIWGTWGDFDDKAVNAINAGDDVDMYFTCSWSNDEYNTFAKRGAWVRLDDPENNLIEKYASDLFKELPQLLVNGVTVDGALGKGIYAVPGYKDMATQNCWDVNVTLLEKYGYTVDDIKNTDYYGFGDIFAKVKAGEGEGFYPLLVEGGVLERMVCSTIIITGDNGVDNLMSYFMNPVNTAEAGPHGDMFFNKFATEEYRRFAEKTREYYELGYIDPALAIKETSNDTRTSKQLKADYLIGTQSYSLGYELQVSQERGIEVAMIPVTPAYVDTTSTQGAMVAISTASKNPDRAMMFLNLLNSDPFVMTTLNYGVEGMHFNKLEDGTIDFIMEARDLYIPWRNGMGNITLLPPTKAEGPDFWDTFKAYYAAADSIPILGFAFDNTSVANEMAALSNVYAQYSLALSSGAVDVDTVLPEFLQRLEDAGMQKYLDEANAQLQVFLAN